MYLICISEGCQCCICPQFSGEGTKPQAATLLSSGAACTQTSRRSSNAAIKLSISLSETSLKPPRSCSSSQESKLCAQQPLLPTFLSLCVVPWRWEETGKGKAELRKSLDLLIILSTRNSQPVVCTLCIPTPASLGQSVS